MSKTKPPAFRSPSEFVKAADAAPTGPLPLMTPANTTLIAGKATVTPDAPTAAKPPAPPRKRPAKAPDIRLLTGTEPMPWTVAHERVIVHFGLRMPEPLHAKLSWLQKNTVNTTMHALALDAVAAEVDRRIAELLGPGKI